MRKIALMLAGVAILGGSIAATTNDASARPHRGYHNRHQVCRVVVRKRVVYRHHRRIVIRDRVRRCF